MQETVTYSPNESLFDFEGSIRGNVFVFSANKVTLRVWFIHIGDFS